jgi:hypothetical protein
MNTFIKGLENDIKWAKGYYETLQKEAVTACLPENVAKTTLLESLLSQTGEILQISNSNITVTPRWYNYSTLTLNFSHQFSPALWENLMESLEETIAEQDYEIRPESNNTMWLIIKKDLSDDLPIELHFQLGCCKKVPTGNMIAETKSDCSLIIK